MTHSIDLIVDEFNAWFEEAVSHPHIVEPSAMSLATVDAAGHPSVRIVLMKSVGEHGISFFTNYDSAKGKALEKNPHAALNFYWGPLKKQIRIEGTVTKTDAKTSDLYFASRTRESQLGAHASQQSEALSDYQHLVQRFEEISTQFAGKPVPRPEHWGGYVLTPTRFEFWEEKPHRLHNRYEYAREGSAWVKRQLNP